MLKTLAIIAGAGLGAAVMYALAPGKRNYRRAVGHGRKPRSVPARDDKLQKASVNLRHRGHRADALLMARAQEQTSRATASPNSTAAVGQLQPTRSSTARRFVRAAGGALVLRYLVRRDSLSMALGVVGLGLLTRRGATKGELKRLRAVDEKHISKREWLLLFGAMPLAFLARFFMMQTQGVVTPDGVYYATLGKQLVAGLLKEGLSTYWPPLYPLLVGCSSLVFRDLEFAGRFVSLLAGSSLLVPAYLLFRRLHGRAVAFIGTFLIVIYPPLVFYSTMLLTEASYTLFFTVAILTALRALVSGASGSFFLTGLLFGACYLTKPEAVGYPGLLLLLMPATKLSGRHLPTLALLRNAFMLLTGFALLSLPYILYLKRATGRWTISDKLQANWPTASEWSNRWFRLPEDGQPTWADRFYAGKQSKIAATHKAYLASLKADNLSERVESMIGALRMQFAIFRDHTLNRALIFFIGLGLFKLAWPEEAYLLLFLFATLLGYALFPEDVDARLLVPLIPVLLGWAARGIVELEDWFFKLLATISRTNISRLRGRKLLTASILVALSFSFGPWVNELIDADRSNQAFEHKKAALWIKAHAPSAPVIMAQGPWAAFYAEGKPVYLPTEEYAVVVEYARRNRVDFIVVDQSHRYPHLQFLFDEESQHPELKLVHRYNEVPHRQALVFVLNGLSIDEATG